MAKTYVDIVKYLIKANIEINGIVEKPDIVGAIFGQTEGLLGDELDLRELQKSGRIGRIEVDTQVRGGKCFGTVTIPSSLDMVETSILAAALEIVDRVGPCEARIRSDRIEDTRSLKRKQVLGRARELLKTMLTSEIPESKELSEMVREDLKIADVISYGAEGLPAGPAIDSSEDIVVVEGRADVLNLLRNGIKNVVAIGGANVGRTITELCRKKEVTAFLDGDRGGDIILKELVNATEIEFVARAPAGHEVEELSRKEIIQCLRRRAPTEQALAQTGGNGFREKRDEDRRAPAAQRVQLGREPHGYPPQRERTHREPYATPPASAQPPLAQATAPAGQQALQPPIAPPAPTPALPPVPPEAAEPLKAVLKELSGSLKAKVFGEAMQPLQEIQVRDLVMEVGKMDGVRAVALDGIVTQRLLDLAEAKGIKYVAGIRMGNVTRKPDAVGVVLAE